MKLGAAALAALGVAMLVLGVRLPIRPSFLVTSVLVYYLAFKSVATGPHALQAAGVLSATPSRLRPENGVLGLFPTWGTTAAQIALVNTLDALKQAWPGVKDLLRLRRQDTYAELEATAGNATAAFGHDQPAADLPLWEGGRAPPAAQRGLTAATGDRLGAAGGRWRGWRPGVPGAHRVRAAAPSGRVDADYARC